MLPITVSAPEESRPTKSMKTKEQVLVNTWCKQDEYPLRSEKGILDYSILQEEILSVHESQIRTPIRADSWQMRGWCQSIWWLCAWNFMWTISVVSFGVVFWPCNKWWCTPNGIAMVIDVLSELVYVLLAIVLRFYVPFPDCAHGRVWNSRHTVFILTVSSFSWWNDVFSSLLLFVGYIYPAAFPYVWYPRLLRVVHFLRDIDARALRPDTLKQVNSTAIAWLLVCIFAFSHVLACFWFLAVSFSWTGTLESFKLHIVRRSHNELTISQESVEFEESSLLYYEWALHWAVMALSTLNFPTCENYFERFALSICIPFSSLFMGMILSRTVGIIHALSLMTAKADQDSQYLECAMISLDLPRSLRKVVSRFHNYASLSIHKDAQHLLTASISDNMKVELQLFLYKDLIESAPFFQPLNASTVVSIVMQLEDSAYCPGDIIIRKGDVGREMYFVISGNIEVIADVSGNVVFAKKSEGEYFGEIALVMDTVRTAWVRSRTYSRTARLTKRKLDDVFAEEPEQKDSMMELIKKLKGKVSDRAPKKSRKPSVMFLKTLDRMRSKSAFFHRDCCKDAD